LVSEIFARKVETGEEAEARREAGATNKKIRTEARSRLVLADFIFLSV
jgi:hypothetical protein